MLCGASSPFEIFLKERAVVLEAKAVDLASWLATPDFESLVYLTQFAQTKTISLASLFIEDIRLTIEDGLVMNIADYSQAILQQRRQVVAFAMKYLAVFEFGPHCLFECLQLFDKVVCATGGMLVNQWPLCLCSCILLAAREGGQQVLTNEQVHLCAGFGSDEMTTMTKNVHLCAGFGTYEMTYWPKVHLCAGFGSVEMMTMTKNVHLCAGFGSDEMMTMTKNVHLCAGFGSDEMTTMTKNVITWLGLDLTCVTIPRRSAFAPVHLCAGFGSDEMTTMTKNVHLCAGFGSNEMTTMTKNVITWLGLDLTCVTIPRRSTFAPVHLCAGFGSDEMTTMTKNVITWLGLDLTCVTIPRRSTFAPVHLCAGFGSDEMTTMTKNVHLCTGFGKDEMTTMTQNVITWLGRDLSCISILRIMEVFVDRLGHYLPPLLVRVVSNPRTIRIRPSILATSILVVLNRSIGQVPSWPVALQQMIGCSDVNSGDIATCVMFVKTLLEEEGPLNTALVPPNLLHYPGMPVLPKPPSLPRNTWASYESSPPWQFVVE
eukprot:gene4861-34620_t